MKTNWVMFVMLLFVNSVATAQSTQDCFGKIFAIKSAIGKYPGWEFSLPTDEKTFTASASAEAWRLFKAEFPNTKYGIQIWIKPLFENDQSVPLRLEGLRILVYSELLIDNRIFYYQRKADGVADLLLIHNPQSNESKWFCDGKF